MADRKKGEDILRRLRKLGARMLLAADALPDTRAWRHVRDQLLTSGSAPGAHYSEAAGAQSKGDFIYKVALALKEQREAVYWVGVCVEGGQAPVDADYLLDEGNQMIAILAASLQTARGTGDREPGNDHRGPGTGDRGPGTGK